MPRSFIGLKNWLCSTPTQVGLNRCMLLYAHKNNIDIYYCATYFSPGQTLYQPAGTHYKYWTLSPFFS